MGASCDIDVHACRYPVHYPCLSFLQQVCFEVCSAGFSMCTCCEVYARVEHFNHGAEFKFNYLDCESLHRLFGDEGFLFYILFLIGGHYMFLYAELIAKDMDDCNRLREELHKYLCNGNHRRIVSMSHFMQPDDFDIMVGAYYAEDADAVEVRNVKLVGIALGYLSSRSDEFVSASLCDFFVEKEYRNQGVGAGLFNKFKEVSVLLDASLLRVDIDMNNERGLQFCTGKNLACAGTILECSLLD